MLCNPNRDKLDTPPVIKKFPYKELGITVVMLAALIAPLTLSQDACDWFSANSYGLFMGGGIALLIGGGAYLYYNRTHFCKKGKECDALPVLLYALLLAGVVVSGYVITDTKILAYNNYPFEIPFTTEWQGFMAGFITIAVAAAAHALAHSAQSDQSPRPSLSQPDK